MRHDAPAVPRRGLYTEQARIERLEWLRRTTACALHSFEQTDLDARALNGNIENFVGGVEIPVGVAGPLLMHGEHARGHFLAPLATSEGALVASTSRGAAAITRAGGAGARVLSQRMVRAPMWELPDIGQAVRFTRWLSDQRVAIDGEVAMVSRHARLVAVEPLQIGRYVHVRFVYETGDAAGQNMTTACTWRACQWINQYLASGTDLRPSFFMIEGNSSGDKKVDHLSFVLGRGFRVTAECHLDAATIRNVLKTSPAAIERAQRCTTLAAMQCGMVGHSANAANIVAAMFTATGQDIACVHESSSALFAVEATDDGLHATMVLPRLVVGSVGGGTALPGQRDCLEMLGCGGDGNAARLAEIICGFALALDLSTAAAVVSGQFADAHERLGRNRPVRWLRRGDLNAALLEPILASGLEDPDLRVRAAAPLDCETGSSILTDLTASSAMEKLTGLFPLRVDVAGAGGERTLELVAKVKALDDEVILEAKKLASLAGARVSDAYARWQDWTGFRDVHTRELAVYRSPHDALRQVLPAVYGVYEDPAREAYVILMERLGDNVCLRDSVDRTELWTRRRVDAALTGIAGVHGRWLGREQDLLREGWLGRLPTVATRLEMRELWDAVLDHNATEHPTLIDASTYTYLKRILEEMPEWLPELERMPQTLVHGDFNPRNIALRRRTGALVAYDWELATVHVPQRDLAEFLAFVLAPECDRAAVAHHVEAHRLAVELRSGCGQDRASWRIGYELALREFALTRLQLYLMAHTHREQQFVIRLAATVKRLLAVEASDHRRHPGTGKEA